MKNHSIKSVFLLLFMALTSAIFQSCKDKDEAKPKLSIPELDATTLVTNISYTTASSGGNITNGGGTDILTRGVCYDTVSNPSIEKNLDSTVDGKGTGLFTSGLTNLLPNKTYFVRAYATNSVGTGYGAEVSFTTSSLPLPIVTTGPISQVGLYENTESYEANLSATIVNLSGGTFVKKGFVWSTTDNNPTLTSNEEIREDNVSISSGNYSLTTFRGPRLKFIYVRSFVTTNVNGIEVTGYGDVKTFETFIKDADGNMYNFSKIGSQIWMIENLNTSKYRDGSAIPTGLNDNQWKTTTTGAYAIYNGNAANTTTYGKLYNWYAATDSRKLCPNGWHTPSFGEWTTLENQLGGTAIAGDKLKAISSLWQNGNSGSSNTSGFTALPGGVRNADGSYTLEGQWGFWWSTDEGPTTGWAQCRYLRTNRADFFYKEYYKQGGNSIRCIKD